MLPKVLIVTTESPDVIASGLSFFNDKFWTELKRINYPFKILYLNSLKTPKSRLADYEISMQPELPFDSSFESLNLNLAWSTSVKIDKIINEYNPDIISIHDIMSLLPLYFHLHKVQFTLHSSYIGMQHYLSRTQKGLQTYWEQRIAVRQSAAVIMHSEWAYSNAKEHISKEISNPHIFPIGLDFSEYAAEKAPHPEGKIVVSFFGRIADVVKNFELFRKAIVTLPTKYRSRIEARVYGPDNVPKDLVHEGFKGLKFVYGVEKRQAYAESDIVVVPSSHESFGIVGLEALLSNCALIATPGLGMASYMPQEYGCLPTVKNIQNRIIQYSDNIKNLRKNQVENIFRNSVSMEKFSIKHMSEKYINVWSEIKRVNKIVVELY